MDLLESAHKMAFDEEIITEDMGDIVYGVKIELNDSDSKDNKSSFNSNIRYFYSKESALRYYTDSLSNPAHLARQYKVSMVGDPSFKITLIQGKQSKYGNVDSKTVKVIQSEIIFTGEKPPQ